MLGWDKTGRLTMTCCYWEITVSLLQPTGMAAEHREGNNLSQSEKCEWFYLSAHKETNSDGMVIYTASSMVTMYMLCTYTWGDSSNFIIKVSFPLFLIFFGGRVSCSPSWLPTHNLEEHDLHSFWFSHLCLRILGFQADNDKQWLT